ncbi:A/G-specific adenine glycosylase [Enterococcus faecium]|uniref:A/G-specific adenine glycosylase n=1 Tax=Enterococcus faecium TaxID=1352 RepID=UPI0001B6ECD0|nr:A/G-specific adenine glycosylase [Enterococcus faecium]EEV51557.1 A/G-specific adenine glycosylase [Enterococcus faecium 1,141,733]EGP4934604.1 A/G-specific adenine glycosylase [Enterococcus faecium]EGP4958084.1 A/G-specific adenine glycosylase [Enterococcus faecium]EGP5366266.1 A/G-specific adenine glycosylase [Enterococcus faecium]EKO5892798.1 A/G-specific adenine glycosylase [Enterococcus faecium]
MNKEWEKWTDEETKEFQDQFIQWYEQEKRNLPWRYNRDPYRIWISEIMLQQTRVDTVIDYFYRFMEWFPTIEELATAPEEKLLKAWEGLGYYSRARNIQAAAKQIMSEFDGKMPQTPEEISSLKGIGPYTTGAIASIAFGLPEPAVDGNVMRVVSRLFCIEADIAKASSRKIFDEAMRKIIDETYPGEFNQAMMDLGSAICTPTSPKCEACPIQAFCLANKRGVQTSFPVKTKKAKPKNVYYISAALQNHSGAYYFEERDSQKLLANMWTFPMVEVTQEEYERLKKEWEAKQEVDLFDDLVAEDGKELPFEKQELFIWQTRHLGEVTHVFSHLKWHVLLFYGRATEEAEQEFTENKTSKWLKPAAFDSVVFPKVQMKLVEQLEKNRNNRNPF